MRVVMFSNLVVSGIARHIINLTNALNKQGIKTYALSFDSFPEGGSNFVKLESFTKLVGMYDVFFNLDQCKEELKRIKPDLLHFHFPSNLLDFFPKKIHNMTKKPYVTTLHVVPFASTTFIDRAEHLYFKMAYSQIKSAKKIICVSEFVKKQLEKHSSIPSHKLVYIPNGVNITVFKPHKKKKSDHFKILFVGRLTPEKGIEHLLKAFKIVSKRIKAKLTIVGFGPVVEKYYRLKLRSHKNINFVGRISDTKKLVKYYSDADLLVFPSVWQEAFGMVLIESLACGTPVVGYRTGAVPYIIEHGKTGFLAHKKTPQALAKAIIHASKQDLKKMGRNGVKVVKQKYAWPIIAKQTKKVYKEVLKP